MARRPSSRNPSPLDSAAVERLALGYVGRYATSRAKLSAYLARKLAERGWAEESPPPVARIVSRMAELGYVDDRAFAEMRGAALGRRGYGARRVGEALRAAGIDAGDSVTAREAADAGAWDAALAFARRRRIGPFARETADPDQRRKALAAMLRAGHALDIARRMIAAAPGESENYD